MVHGEVVQEKKLVGEVIDYYKKIGVAAVELSAKLRVGEYIEIVAGHESFTMKVESMQINGIDVEEGLEASIIGIKVNARVRKGALVFKLADVSL